MFVHLLRRSRFFVCFYGDSIVETELYAKNFQIKCKENKAVFTIEIIEKGLDFIKYQTLRKEELDTFVIEDSFIVRKFIRFLEQHPEIKFFNLQIVNSDFKIRIKQVKVKSASLYLFTY